MVIKTKFIRGKTVNISLGFTTNLSNFCQSTMIHDILQSVVETASVVLLRNTNNVHVVEFTKEIFTVKWWPYTLWNTLLFRNVWVIHPKSETFI